MNRYLKSWLIMTAVLCSLAACINLVVDPYSLFGLVDSTGFNAIKPTAGNHGAMVKAYQVLRVRPGALILGNSRSEVGFDPAYDVWAPQLRPVYDLALPGTGTHSNLMYLRHVLENQKTDPPKTVVWGIDFMDFLVDARKPSRVESSKYPRLLANADGTPNAGRILQEVKDYANSIFTLSALFDSFSTIIAQHERYPLDLTPLGSNPMRDYIKITADEGAWSVFRQKDMANIRSFLKRPNDIIDESNDSSTNLDDLRNVIRICREHDIKLYLVIYPYHAHLLETFRVTGHWNTFEIWKKTVLHIAYNELISNGFPNVPLWDFSQFNAYTEEIIPPIEDHKSAMKWWWEAGHFKRELGNLVLSRVLGVPGAPKGFGVELNPGNINSQLELNEEMESKYRTSHPMDTEELELVAKQMRADNIGKGEMTRGGAPTEPTFIP